MGSDDRGVAEDAPARARPAATVVLLRQPPAPHDRTADNTVDSEADEAADGAEASSFEVLLLRKGAGNPFAAGAWVFPGGAVDPADRGTDATLHTAGDLDARAERLRVPLDLARGWHAAAVREAFEEAGVLLAAPDPDRGGALPEAEMRAEARRALVHGEWDAAAFHAWVREHGCRLDTAGLALLRRWITPRSEPRRYDTLFVVAAAPRDQDAWADEAEVTAHRWIRPQAALRAFEDGLLPLIHPTVQTLRALVDCGSIEDACRLGGDGDVPPTLPHIATDGRGAPRILEPGDVGYPETLVGLELPEWA